MKTVDQLSGIADGVIGETEPAKPQFDVLVPQEFQTAAAANRTHQFVVLDPRSPQQVAFVLPRDGALELARQLLENEKAMSAEEHKAKEPSKILLPGLGGPIGGNVRPISKAERC
jgi:hypothetical protein